MEYNVVHHPFGPLYDAHSRVLILGSIPSPKSREVNFFYGHPQNRFWRVLAAVLGESAPETIEEKRAMALRHGVALWDTLASCEIRGASDAAIRNPVPNDIASLIKKTQIHAVFCTGAVSHKLYTQLCQPQTGIPAVKLPSTSPANAAWSFERLTEAYRVIAETLQ
ncbi:MAG: DNA-deoxyinosine glycosylase [Clostridiaceae bacterium]|nr:DNA-deoxyinosine glycosylase [Clostridiaceae bacterium]